MKILLYLLLCLSSSLAFGATMYVNVNEIFPAQLRYSSENVKEKIEKKIKKGHAWQNTNTKQWEHKFYNGKSIFDSSEAFAVIKTSFGYVLVDGHHDILSSLDLQADWIPIKITSDMSQLSVSDFWYEAEKQGLVYLYDINGERHIPPRSFYLLEDDPNRYFAAISARKISGNNDTGTKESTGSDYPIWIKTGRDIPFIEFKIADVLWKNGINYNYDMGKNPPEELVEKARAALVAAKIPGLKVVPKRKKF